MIIKEEHCLPSSIHRGNIHFSNSFWKEYAKVLILKIHTLIMRIDILSCPRTLFQSDALIDFLVSPLPKSKVKSLFSVSKVRFVERELFWTNVLHCLLKKLLSRFGFSKKSVTSRLPTDSGGVRGILKPF